VNAGVLVGVATEIIPPVNPTLVTVPVPEVIVLQPNPVPDVQIKAFVAPLQDGKGRPDTPVAVSAPNTVFAVCVARVAVKVPELVTALEGVELSTTPSPVKVTLVTVPVPHEPGAHCVPL
jgi:hypothetical protein